jgi:hypothetical protein
MLGKVLALILFVSLAGCASGKSDPFTPATLVGTGDAILYIYRPPEMLTWNTAAAFEVDKKLAGKIKPGGHLKIHVKQGLHTVGWRERALGLPLWGRSIKVPAKAGESYYVRADWRLDAMSYSPNGPMPIYSMHLKLIPDQQALVELQNRNH